MSEDYALVRYKDISAGFVSAQSSDLIVNAVNLMMVDLNPIGHHWERVDGNGHDHIYRSIEPVSGSVRQFLRARSNEGTVKLTYFSTDATVEDFDDYGSIETTSQLLEEFDLRGNSEFYNQPPSNLLDQSKIHRIWLAEYRENISNPCATENACALTIIVEEITDEGTNDARFVLGAHVGSVITPVSANERLARLEDITISEEEPTFLYALSTDAALVGVPNNPNRIVPDVLIVEEEPSWLGQNTAVSGSWVQFGPKREGLAAIGQGNHLPDSYMLPINGRQKLLPFTNYAKNIRNIRFEKFSCKGSSSAAIDDKGVLYTWGFRTDIGDFESLLESNIKFLDIIHTYPTPVLNPNEYSGPWKDTTTAGFSLFAIDANDRLWVRGNTNDDGQLGLGNFLPSAELKLVLTPINHSGKWKKVFANEQFCLGLDANDKLWSWGRNQSGQLGISETGEETNKNIPTLVIDPDGWNGAKWVQASAGGSHSLGIDDQGRAWAWGNNAVGELGTGEDGPGTGKSIPTRVIDPEDWNEAKWIQVSAGGQYSLGIDDQGRAWAWGENDDGELGTGEDGSGTNKNIPTLVIDPEGWNGAKWIQVSAGSSHSLGIDDQGRAWAWGGNTAGELGTGEAGPGTEKNTPTLIGNEYWIQIEASNQQLLNISLALDNNNNIWAWGYNFFGQLGLNQSENLIFIDSNFSFRTFFSDPPDKNVPTKLNYYITKPISTELGRTRYVRQFGTEPLEHGIILVSSTPSSQQAWKALGNGSNQVILWSLIAVQVP